MSGRVVWDIQARAEGESLYIRYNTDANVEMSCEIHVEVLNIGVRFKRVLNVLFNLLI